MKALISVPDRVRKPNYVARAAFASGMALIKRMSAEDVYRSRHKDEAGAGFMRAVVSGASTINPDWAGNLVAEQFIAFLVGLEPLSAASRLIDLGPKVTLDGFGQATFPVRNGAPSTVPWVAEGGPIPVVARLLTSVSVGPAKKIAVITALSGELARRADGERIFTQLLREDAAATLDLAYFSTTAESASAHGGLLWLVTPITASTAGGAAAMTADLSALIGAVTVGGSGQVVIVMSTAAAATFPVTAPEVSANLTVLGSTAVPDNRVIAVDPLAIIHGTDPAPAIDTSRDATLHYDTAPAQIVTGGTMAAPTQSLFQTDAIAVRIIQAIAFAKRRPNAVAYVDGIDWI